MADAPEDLCTTVAAEAWLVRLVVASLRSVEGSASPESALRHGVARRMAQLLAWAESEGLRLPSGVARYGYLPPWAPERQPPPFQTGRAWVDVHQPRFLHPLPRGHRAVAAYLERAARDSDQIPGITPVPPEALAGYQELYDDARRAYELQPAVLLAATEQQRSIRKAWFAARDRRVRSTGGPGRLVSFSELLAAEADAAEGAFETLIDWIRSNCPPAVSAAIPALGAGHRLPAPE